MADLEAGFRAAKAPEVTSSRRRPSRHRRVAGGGPGGRRQWVRLDRAAAAEFGGELPGVPIAYETWGTLDPTAPTPSSWCTRSPVTAMSPGPPGRATRPGLVGRPDRPGRALDTDALFVVAPTCWAAARAAPGPSSPAPDGGRGAAASRR